MEAIPRSPAANASPATSSTGLPRPARRSIAVLGFRNLSGRPEEIWLSTALAEMLSAELEAGEELRLVSGEDVARTKLDLPLADADSLSRNTTSTQTRLRQQVCWSNAYFSTLIPMRAAASGRLGVITGVSSNYVRVELVGG